MRTPESTPPVVQVARQILVGLCMCLAFTAEAGAAAGDLDTAFGDGGEVLQSRSGADTTTTDTVYDIGVQPGGKELVVGSRLGPTSTCNVVRYDAGHLDTSYGVDGVADLGALTGKPVCDRPHGLLTASGSAVVAALTDDGSGSADAAQTRLLRLTPEGQLDDTFGSGGTVRVGPGGDSVLELVAQEDGSLVVVVGPPTGGGSAAYRFSATGEPDLTYGSGGVLQLPDSTAAVTSQGDRLIALFVQYDHPHAGEPGVANPQVLGRWTADGQRDTFFGTRDTHASHDLAKGEAFGVVTASAERIAVGGSGVLYHSDSTNFDDETFASVKTFGADGQDGGESTVSLRNTYPYGDASVSALRFMPDGKLVAAGYYGTYSTQSMQTGLHVSRFSSSGVLDSTWEGDGSFTRLAQEQEATPQTITADGDGVLVGGARKSPNRETLGHLLRLQSGEASFCLLPPEDGAPFPEATTVPASGTVTGSRSSTRAADGKATKGSLVFGSLVAVGCFSDLGGGRWQADSPNTRVNGIDLTRGASSLVIDVNARRITSSGPVRISVGNQTLRNQTIDWTVAANTLELATPEEGTKLARFRGMSISGTAKIVFSRDGNEGSTTWTLGLAFPTTNWSTWRYGRTLTLNKGVNGPGFDVSFTSSNSGGAIFQGLNFKADELVIAKRFKLTDVTFGLDFPTSVWSGSGKFTLPGGRVIAGAAARDANGWRGLSAELDGAGVPLFSGIFLQRLSMGFDVADKDGTATPAISGGAGFSAGPKIPLPGGKSTEAASVDGKLTYSYVRPGVDVYKVAGGLKLVGNPVSNGVMTIQDGGHKTDFTGTIDLGSKKGALVPYKASATVTGWAESTTGFNAQGAATARFLGLEGNGQLLMSSAGYGVCIGTLGRRAGYGYSWGNDTLEWFGSSCDVGRFREARKATTATASAAGSRRIVLPAGLPLAVLKVSGGKSAPDVRVKGPGLSVSTPADGSSQSSRASVAQDPEHAITYVILDRPAAGTYVVTGNGIRGVQTAEGLKTPKITASVTGAGAQRKLTWTAGDLDGQELQFVEETPEGRAVLASSNKRRDSVTFTPQLGDKHTVTAYVLNRGVPRDSRVVATFVVKAGAAAVPLTRPSGLKLKRTGSGILVTFKAVPGAAGYSVKASVRRGGRTVSKTVRTSRVRVTVRVPRGVTTVGVTALAADGTRGAVATKRLR